MFRRNKKKKDVNYEDETHKSLVNTVSGYKSYNNVKDRDPTDKALRKFLNTMITEILTEFSNIAFKLMKFQVLSTWKASDDIKQKLDQIAKTLNAKDTDIYRHSTFFDTPEISEWIDIPVVYILESEMIIICDSLVKILKFLNEELDKENLDDIEKKINNIKLDVSELNTMILDRAELLASFEIVGF